MPAPQPSNSHFVFHLPRQALRVAGIAFGVGLLLFVAVWWSGRDSAFYKLEPATQDKPLTQLEPLPEPLPGGNGASDMPAVGAPAAERPQLVEAPPPLPPAVDENAAPVAADGAGPSSREVAPAPGNQPVPISSPAPRYPSAALRRGEGGTVLVRVEVDTAGMPVGVALVQRSGSRDLDRAAMEAVREWRFQPAQRDGQPVAASLVVPIDFRVD